MDPNATLEMIHNALFKAQDWDKAREHMLILEKWKQKGGFDPNWDDYPIASKVFYLFMVAGNWI
jgi:hypothetical protein